LRDGIYFEAESAADIERAFHEVVDDFLPSARRRARAPRNPTRARSTFA